MLVVLSRSAREGILTARETAAQNVCLLLGIKLIRIFG